MSFTCPLHGWHSHEFPCPACASTVTTSGDQPIIINESDKPTHNELCRQLFRAKETIKKIEESTENLLKLYGEQKDRIEELETALEKIVGHKRHFDERTHTVDIDKMKKIASEALNK